MEIKLETKVVEDKKRLMIPQVIIDYEAEKKKNCLVGRFVGIRPNLDLIRNWIKEKWKTTGQVDLIVMPKEFLMFRFANTDDMRMVMELGPWFLGRKGLVLKKWHVGFRPEKENFNIVPVWMNLPNLPSTFWNMNIIAAIANRIGELVTIDRTPLNESRMEVARFCIHLDITGELDHKIYLDTEDGESWEQEIVYEHLPIRCKVYGIFDGKRG